jgi:hypothetical protein
MTSLLQAAGLTLLLLAMTFGAHISGGIFMPLIFVGSCLGRAAGQFFQSHVDPRIFPGGYALAGAAVSVKRDLISLQKRPTNTLPTQALLGGVQRGTISLVVILMEGTSNVHMLLPVVTAICASNFVCNVIAVSVKRDLISLQKRPTNTLPTQGREGIYDIILRRKHLRWLDTRPSGLMSVCFAGTRSQKSSIL